MKLAFDECTVQVGDDRWRLDRRIIDAVQHDGRVSSSSTTWRIRLAVRQTTPWLMTCPATNCGLLVNTQSTTPLPRTLMSLRWPHLRLAILRGSTASSIHQPVLYSHRNSRSSNAGRPTMCGCWLRHPCRKRLPSSCHAGSLYNRLVGTASFASIRGGVGHTNRWQIESCPRCQFRWNSMANNQNGSLNALANWADREPRRLR